MTRLLASILLCLAPWAALAQSFNELQGSNLETLLDEDGDSSDWIELYNSGPGDLDLTGFGLSDRANNPFRWTFPTCTIPADSTLLVFASGKDRGFWLAHWETLLDHHDLVRYRPGNVEPPADWREIAYDDSDWLEGPTSIGYGDGDDDTVVHWSIKTWYARKTFTVDDLSNIGAVAFHMDYDDGYVAYLNGVEISRGHMGDPGPPPPHDAFAESPREATLFLGNRPESKFIFDNALLVAGENVLAVQVHNIDIDSQDLSMIPFLTLGMHSPPAGAQGLSETLFSQVPQLHANFEINPGSESLFLTAPGGQLIDQANLPAHSLDHSFGRYPDGTGPWFIHETPTPWMPNSDQGQAGYTEEPDFSVEGGFYSGGISVELETESPLAEIHYTLDASDPHEGSPLYQFPIAISETRVLRARAFQSGKAPSAIVTHSYFFGEGSSLPIISLVTDPPNLWDDEIGIYVLGNDYYPGFPYYGANFWQDWERPAHLEYFEPDGELGFATGLGLKVHGGMTRAFDQKSLRLMARQGYGESHIDYPLFPEKDIDAFKRILLRNSGNDWCRSMLRDGLIHRAVASSSVDRMAYEPAIVFLNGEYWGIHNLRERIGKYFLEENHDVDPEAVDILEFRWEVVEGDSTHYRAMLDYIDTNGLSDPAHYDYIGTQMDLEEFSDYWIFQVFFGNTDWPAGNVKFWRPRTAEGRWRWLLFDTDFGLGYWNNYAFDTLSWSMADNGSGQNQPWSTYLIRKLMENSEFERRFINRYADHLNTRFRAEILVDLTESLRATIEPEITRHQENWSYSYESWQSDMAVVEEFVQLRPAVARGHLRLKFGLSSEWTLSLNVSPPGTGSVKLEAIQVSEAWSGSYFMGVPVEVTAIPSAGFEFAAWSDAQIISDIALIDAAGDSSLVAFFQEAAGARVVINEINYNAPDESDPGDWVELHNHGSETVDISGWIFTDDDVEHAFVIPQGATLAAGGYLVLCEELLQFETEFPGLAGVIGDLGFGFSGGGEELSLFNSDSLLMDQVEYDDAPPWPLEADGFGPTLELIAAGSDNSLPGSWAASWINLGTPGEVNSVTSGTAADPELPSTLVFNEPWPNPFNPSISLRFGLPNSAKVNLAIFDLRGRRIARIVNTKLDAGYHEFTWNAQGRASGLYFARFQAGGKTQSKKLLLLK